MASNGGPDQQVSLYEHICTHLCGLIGCFPARHFHHLETCLMQHLISRNSFVSSLACDAWCYMARFGTAKLCYQHTELLIQSYLQLEGQALQAGQPLLTLIRRLVKFLAPDHQKELLKRFLPSTKACLWKELPVSIFPEGSRFEIIGAVWGETDAAVEKFLQDSRRTYGDLQDLTQSLEGLNVFLQDQESRLHLSPGFTCPCRQLWSIAAGQWQTDQYFRKLLAEMVMLYAHLVPQLEERDILMVLKQLPVPIDDNKTKLSVMWFLLNISKIQFSPHPELSQTMSQVPQLFKALLTDNHSLVHHQALDVFTQFAETTPYETLVPQCLGENETLQEAVVAYLNKIPHSSPGFDDIQYIRQAQSILQGLSTRKAPPYKQEDILDMIKQEPVTKRKRTDDMDKDSEVSAILGDLRTAVARLETLSRPALASAPCREELLCINTRLKTIIDSL